MKLIELLRALDAHTYVRIKYFDYSENETKMKTVTGETTIRGYTKLLHEINGLNIAHAQVTQIFCLWHAQELYIECAKW
jgi:hypothetical protein